MFCPVPEGPELVEDGRSSLAARQLLAGDLSATALSSYRISLADDVANADLQHSMSVLTYAASEAGQADDFNGQQRQIARIA